MKSVSHMKILPRRGSTFVTKEKSTKMLEQMRKKNIEKFYGQLKLTAKTTKH